MRTWAEGAALGVLLAAAFFLPYAWKDELLFPMAASEAPPWWRPDAGPVAPQDGAGTDKIIFNFPNWVHVARSWREAPSELLWNSRNFSGTPFFATHNTAVFYPLTWLALLRDPAAALLLHAAIHVALATAFAYAALRQSRLAKFGAVIGALAFGGGGWISVHHDTIQFVQAGTWVPLLILGALRVATAPRRGAAAVAIATCLSVLGGMPQVTILGLIVAGLTAVAHVAGSRPISGHVKGIAAAGAGVVIGLLLAAPQLLPTWEFARLSSRLEQDVGHLAKDGLHPIEFVSLVIPPWLGIEPEVERRQRASEADLPPGTSVQSLFPPERYGVTGLGSNAIERSAYVGWVAIVAALVSACAWRDRRAWFLLALTGAAAFISLGGVGFEMVALLPGFRFGSPKRWIFVVALGLCGLAGLGADFLGRGRVRAWRANGCAAAALLAAFTVAFLCFPEVEADGGASLPAYLWPELLKLLGVAAFTVGALWLPMRMCKGALILLVVAELALWNRQMNPGQRRAPLFPRTPSIEALAARVGPEQTDYRFARFKNPLTDVPEVAHLPVALPPNLGLIHRLRDLQGYEAIVDQRLEELAQTIEPDLLVAHHLFRELRELPSLTSPILDLLAVRWILSSGPLPLPLAAAFPEERVAIFERQTALPRATIVPLAVVVDDAAAALTLLRDPAHAPRDRTVLNRREVEDVGAVVPQSPVSLPADAFARIESETGAELKIRFRAAPGAMLRLADMAHPGWKAEVEGQEVPILLCDHALRGIVLPISEGVVTFRFAPRSLLWGLVAAALGVVVSVLALSKWRPARERPSVSDLLPHA